MDMKKIIMAFIFFFQNYYFKYILITLRYKFNTRYKPSSLELMIMEDTMLMLELNVWSMDTFLQYIKYRNQRSSLSISHFATISLQRKVKFEQEIHTLHKTGNLC